MAHMYVRVCACRKQQNHIKIGNILNLVMKLKKLVEPVGSEYLTSISFKKGLIADHLSGALDTGCLPQIPNILNTGFCTISLKAAVCP